jgi:hypothetical protein
MGGDADNYSLLKNSKEEEITQLFDQFNSAEASHYFLQSQRWISSENHKKNYKKEIRFLLTVAGITLITVAALNPATLALSLPALLPCGFSSIALGQLITSRNKINTIAAGTSLVICTMIAALLFAMVSVTTGNILLASGCFISNKILFDVNMKKMLKSSAHFFQRNSVRSWTFWRKMLGNMLSGSLSLYLASIWTVGMYIGASSFIAHSFLATSILITPQIAIPFLAICYVCNLAFAKKGIDYVKNIFFELYQCLTTDKMFKDQKNDDPIKYSKGWQALSRYLFHFKHSDYENSGSKFHLTRFKRVLYRLGLLTIALGAGYLSQHAVFLKFLGRIAAFHFTGLMASPIAQKLLHISLTYTTLTISAIVTRIVIISPKIFNTLTLNIGRLTKINVNNIGSTLKNIPSQLRKKLTLPSIKDYIKPYVISTNARDSFIDKIDTLIYNEKDIEKQGDLIKIKKSKLNQLDNHIDEAYKNLFQTMTWYNKSWYILQATTQKIFNLLAIPAILSNAYANQYFATDTTEKATNVVTSLGVNLNAYASQVRSTQNTNTDSEQILGGNKSKFNNTDSEQILGENKQEFNRAPPLIQSSSNISTSTLTPSSDRGSRSPSPYEEIASNAGLFPSQQGPEKNEATNPLLKIGY